MKHIGVLGFQGSVEEHLHMLSRLKVEAIRVIDASTLSSIDGIVIPGGESTTFLKILHFSNLYEPLLAKIKHGIPVMATCAGIILLASHIDNIQQESMGLLPISVSRNGYGRQISSFCEDVTMEGFNQSFQAIFIRAPIITHFDPIVSVLARDKQNNPILIQKNNIIGATFHPELTDDTRIHEFFIDLIDKI